MIPPGKPKNEEQRLKSLRSLGILDTPHEERFDRLTRMAKKLFGVSVALVSLVDADRQWFKSCDGLDASETHRDNSFCGHAILGKEVFIIPDASKDERFFDNPFVTGAPNIRFYAGCPLTAPDGCVVGTLCIIDQQPRNLSAHDIETLTDLAHMVERELAAVQLATIDELTHISNRRGFLLLAQQALLFCKRMVFPASLVFIDLNKFKYINDTYGHAEGDRVLNMFAENMRLAFRESDIPGRLSGDEFAVFLVNSDRNAAEDCIARLHSLINQHTLNVSKSYDVKFSYGIVEFDSGKHSTIETMMGEADTLMYEHKRSEQ